MATEKPKQHQPLDDADYHGEVPLEERDLEPKSEKSEKIRGGVLPPSEIRGTYLVPPET